MVKTAIKKYTFAVGRRKSAVVTVKVFSGKGDFSINGAPAEQYFPGEVDKIMMNRPFAVTDTDGKFYFESNVVGGGKQAQMEALTLALARALRKINESAYASLLRQAGLLSVDSRVRERRKVGTGGKARRAKQSPKR